MARPFEGHLLTEEQKRLVEENINFVWYFYNNHVSESVKNLNKTDKEELISDLFLNLCLAAEKYDPNRGKFTTIANFYLRRAVSRYFETKKSFSNKLKLYPFITDDNISLDFTNHEKIDGEKYYKVSKHGGKIEESNISEYFEKLKWEEIIFLINSSFLSEEEKKIFLYFYRDEYSFSEIKDVLGLSRASIFQKRNSALQKIKKYFHVINISKDDLLIKG